VRDLFLIIYFFLLFYIAFYGIHLYWLIFLYFKYNNENISPHEFTGLYPHLTVQLPIYNEKLVATRLINSIAFFDWPMDKLQIQVLDDSDDETSEIIANEVVKLQEKGIDISHVQRGSREGFKAGALSYGLETAKGEFIAVFDADNLPRPDFLKRIMPYFESYKIGMVQARWSFLNRDESLLCRAQALFLDSHFFVEQKARHVGGLFMNFNGTAGVWRRKAIESAGGWRSDTLTEDLDLSYAVQMKGWKMIYAEDVDVPTELPSSIRAFKTQQYRWSKGAVETGMKFLPGIFKADLPFKIKLGSFFHLTQKSVSFALLLLALCILPALYLRLQSGSLKLLLIDLPIFILGTGSMSLFYGLAYKKQNQVRTLSNSLILPILTSLGIALSVNNSLAIFSALFRRAEEFIRTPKSGSDQNRRKILPNEYKVKFDHTVKIEIFIALYAITSIICSIFLNLYFSIPFLMTFAFGYSYFSIISVREEYA
jgi:cellulose synthase/poly-beta-1,6-N-acetylglucosamine synthase-like glycosyltransferase